MRKNIIFLFVILMVLFSFLVVQAQMPELNIGSLKGPTTMGMVKMLDNAENGISALSINSNLYGTADEVVTGIVSGKLDAAAAPCNLAAVLYNKTEGKIQVAAINTLGVLYIVETGNEIQSVADLKGKTIFSTGKGTTPEFALNYVLAKNGLTPNVDVMVEYKSEATEVAAILAEAGNVIAMLPQPYVTAVMAQNEKVQIALDMTEEWEKVDSESSLITGCLMVRKDFAEQNPAVVTQLLTEYSASVEFVNTDLDAAAELIVKYGIVAKAPLAKKAIPACNIVFLTGEELKTKLSGYLSVLFDADPKSVGGNLPGDDFYYLEK